MKEGRLEVKGLSYDYEIFLAPELITTVMPFLNGEQRSRTWNEQVDAEVRR